MNRSRRPLIAGNWKMNHGGASACTLAADVAKGTAAYDRVDVLVAPPLEMPPLRIQTVSSSR